MGRSILMVLDTGLKAYINYLMGEDEDDSVADVVRKHWENKDMFFPEAEVDANICINGDYIDEIDMRRVVAVSYNDYQR